MQSVDYEANETLIEINDRFKNFRVHIVNWPDELQNNLGKLKEYAYMGFPKNKPSGKLPLLVALHGAGGKAKGPKQMTHYRWTGHKWTKGERLGPPEADGDIRVSSPGNVSLLLAYKNDDKTGEVAWWTSADGDQRFKKGKVLIHGKKTRFAITSIIRNAHPDAIVVVAGKKGGSDFTKMYLLGDNGACQRAKADADQLSASQKTASKRTKQK